MTRLSISPLPDGKYAVRFPYDPAMVETIKAFGGAKWNGDYKYWACGPDIVGELTKTAPKKLHVLAKPEGYPAPALRDYQEEAVARALTQKRLFIAFEMGLGKTAVAIETVRRARGVTLVVCPAFVRSVWAREFERWAPELRVFVAADGKARPKGPTAVVVTSYELMGGIDWVPFTNIVFDESHYLKNAKAERAKVGRGLASLAKLVLLLTGTPIQTEPQDLHNQLDILSPGAFGSWWSFTRRYCGLLPEPRARSGVKVKGINADRAQELSRRLSWYMVRKTRQEVAHLLPRLTFQRVEIRNGVSGWKDPGALSKKMEAVVGLAEEAQEGGQRCAIGVYHHNEAQLVASALLKAGVPSEIVTGEMPQKKREAAIKRATTLVVTMPSSSLGIDLSAYPVAIIAELYSQPSLVAQFVARFGRTAPGIVYLLVVLGSKDELVAKVLTDRFQDQKAVFSQGAAEEAVSKSLAQDEGDMRSALLEMMSEQEEI